MWCVVDEFGFVVDARFQTKEEAEESRNVWANIEVARQWDLKYEIEYREE